jgi:hypothetical protein
MKRRSTIPMERNAKSFSMPVRKRAEIPRINEMIQ